MRILICVAMRSEEEACRRGIERAGRAGEFEILRTGMGLRAAKEALTRRLASGPAPRAIISSGFAGAWSEGLSVGTAICATEIWERDQGGVRRILALDSSGFSHAGNRIEACALVSVPRIQAPGLLPEAIARGNVGVDMESSALAQVAQLHGIPFAVLRVITDTPADPLPAFLGSLSSAIVSQSLAEKCAEAVRGLVQLSVRPQGLWHLAKHGPKWTYWLRELWEKEAKRPK